MIRFPDLATPREAASLFLTDMGKARITLPEEKFETFMPERYRVSRRSEIY